MEKRRRKVPRLGAEGGLGSLGELAGPVEYEETGRERKGVNKCCCGLCI